ncbi:MAG: carotenoid oxygenase family protein [Oscillatoriaceae bacterium SKW80]|nr:carotenoid oxygenase family protein [Oscillatoriaceae bacterium SKYG93]MCX8122240.1 carotenoid oxygenase family protein [Oscillatoriaceae bacterium SKW80]MDW8454526.1 carotenoid oxygenase family protein [Oscillatoriaceae cyanobacterium SKYGB_i_bin93]HIK29388.1 carotenoid oxygenase family protein [Oscillatoriaceae cyanobacterium M7585_C2015_266]
MTVIQPLQKTTWAKAIASPAAEFNSTPLKITKGEIPAGLRGSLYRNGPARLKRGSQSVAHWFDGDGAILAIHFTGTGATGVYRYVQTAGYQAEEKAGKFLYGGYGMISPLPWWQRFGKSLKNTANTSVLALPDKLLALWEGAHPYALDLQTLETIGSDNLGWLKANWSFSAHPKVDPHTGEIYNFGVTPGKNSTLHVYRCARTGKLLKHSAIRIIGVPLIHDFILAGKYLVFFIPPVRLQLLPVLLQLKSFSDALTWHPEKGTQIFILERDTLNVVSYGEAEPWYQWHFGNGCTNENSEIVADVVRYPDFQTNQRLKEIAAGETKTLAVGTLWQLRLDPNSGQLKEIQKVLDRSCDFPTVAASEIGQTWRYTYLSLHSCQTDIQRDIFTAIGRFDYHTGTLTEADLGKNRFPSEPIYAPDADNPGRGWVLTIVFDGERAKSEVWIYDAERLDAPPVCCLELPKVVPFGFHGIWKAEGM